MNHKYRISSPQVFETVLRKSKIFRKHEWLFDNHPGIVSGFRPDVRVTFNSNTALMNNQFGHVATIDRQLVAHPSIFLDSERWSFAELKAQTYVTMTHDDDSFLSVAATDGLETLLRPSKVFRVNDVRAAELAVKLKIGYSALPKFLSKDDITQREISESFFAGWKVSPTYLRILSSGRPDMHLSNIHEAILGPLTSLVNSPWRSFGQTQNIVPMVSSK